MALKTKKVTVCDQEFTIKRFSFEEAQMITACSNALERQATEVWVGTAEPKFESVETVKKADNGVVFGLYVEIEDFNQIDLAFLSRLKKLSLQGSQTLVTPSS